MDSLEIAVKMYEREHQRWYQWAFIFLGAIVSTTTVIYKFQDAFRFENLNFTFVIISIVNIALSSLWINSALAIRASTKAWERTISNIENTELPVKVFTQFKTNISKSDPKNDRKAIQKLRKCENSITYSVTSNLTRMGILSRYVFILCLLISIVKLLMEFLSYPELTASC